MDLTGKVVLLTGASMGIGAATARALAQKGARLALAARSTDKLEKLAAELPDAISITADVTNADDIERMIDVTCKHFGRIDVLINNAGQGLYGGIEYVPIPEFERIVRLNVTAPLMAMKAVIPIMRKQGGGTILNVSSLVSKNYFPYLGAYAATKYALNGITQTARAELATDGIRVSAMLPGLTDTEFGKNAIKFDSMGKALESRTRPGTPSTSHRASSTPWNREKPRCCRSAASPGGTGGRLTRSPRTGTLPQEGRRRREP